MIHPPLSLAALGLNFPQKLCFTNFSTHIHPGMRIALIGRNGSGKTTLLKMIQGLIVPSEGHIYIPSGITFGYVPQVIENFDTLSGGQRLNKALTRALAAGPDIVLLDEPTNHLDAANRRSLMRLLQKFAGTLIVVSHDVELLRTCITTLWHIEEGKVTVFSGNHDDYLCEKKQKRVALTHELHQLDRQKKATHHALMKEQNRAKHSRLRGEKHISDRKWPTIVSGAKARRAEETSGRKKNDIGNKKQDLMDKLSELRLPEILKPKFSLMAADIRGKRLVSIGEGSVGYGQPVLERLNLSLAGGGRLAIIGENGSGKTTLVKAIRNDPAVKKTGGWHLPSPFDIGYLDQHYDTLTPSKTVLETLQEAAPLWPLAEIRRHLNDFLFRKDEEVSARVSTLSGGEKARLSLAQIAAKTPRLLILDEMSNNLDLETRDHVIQVLRSYPGALIVISHDPNFLAEIGIQNFYDLSARKDTA